MGESMSVPVPSRSRRRPWPRDQGWVETEREKGGGAHRAERLLPSCGVALPRAERPLRRHPAASAACWRSERGSRWGPPEPREEATGMEDGRRREVAD